LTLYQPGASPLVSSSRLNTPSDFSSTTVSGVAEPILDICRLMLRTAMPSETRPPTVIEAMPSSPSYGVSRATTGGVLSTDRSPAAKPVVP